MPPGVLPLTEFVTSPPFSASYGEGGAEVRDAVAQVVTAVIRDRALVMPAAQDEASHPARVVGPPPNHNPAPKADKIATAVATELIHLALCMPSDCGA
ncbi:hypothetical protein ADL05_13170 [Nocardiopsis sp. NRRL B-16309]|nr:hypothetical protein ADL05_13170 [Nocardiopsis sp. NRRL B-16309]